MILCGTMADSLSKNIPCCLIFDHASFYMPGNPKRTKHLNAEDHPVNKR